MFAGDNNDYLPPGSGSSGLGAGQQAAYGTPAAGQYGQQQLIYNIANYLGAKEPGPQLQICNIFICPASIQGFPNMVNLTNDVPYIVITAGAYAGPYPTAAAAAAAGSPPMPWNPFGYVNNGITTVNYNPHKLSEVSGSIWGGKMPWMLTDTDALGLGATSVWPGLNFPPVPAHGTSRNYVFFDGHIQNYRLNMGYVGFSTSF
jgi:prepilin-type processing-associated H-X9-DG protein